MENKGKNVRVSSLRAAILARWEKSVLKDSMTEQNFNLLITLAVDEMLRELDRRKPERFECPVCWEKGPERFASIYFEHDVTNSSGDRQELLICKGCGTVIADTLWVTGFREESEDGN